MTADSSAFEVRSICRICVAGCGIRVALSDGVVTAVRGDPEHPASRGYICPKGAGLPWNHHRPDRLDTAYVRGAATTADACAGDLAASIRSLIAQHGVEAFGGYVGTGARSGDVVSLTALNRLLRAIGTPQVYSSMTVDMAPAWRAAEIVAGSAAEISPRWTPDDEASRLVLFIGCNPSVSHGYFTILTDPARRLRRYQQRGGRVWVIDPRATETARRAAGHLAPRPGTDAFILAWLLREVLADAPTPASLAAGVAAQDAAALWEAVQALDRDSVARLADVDTEALDALLADVRAAGRLAIVTGTGVTFAPHALTTELLRWALLAVTGSLDQPGGMFFDPGYGSKLEERLDWRAAPEAGDLAPGAASRPELFALAGERPVAAIIDEIEAGTLKGLLVAGGSPLTAFPEPERLKAALQSLDVLAVVDIARTPLTDMATHVFPALGQLERSGVAAWNGRAAFTPAVVSPAAGRQAAWRLYARIAEAFGADILDGHPADADELDVLETLLATARFDLPALRAAGPWGLPMPAPSGWVRRALPGGRWRIASPTLLARLRALLEASAESAGDLLLVSRRQVQHYSATQYMDEGRRHDAPLLLISPADAQARDIATGDRVRVAGAAGDLSAVAQVTANIRGGVVSLPHGWFDANVAVLISNRDGVDPLTGQPQMSGVPVSVARMQDYK
jgi:anaerobic selenocysteine-containing dehydrogenase